ncbi:hypothetical protein RvY_10960-2 [Ramazzottius varieornatus]|uniref:Uncharacterized protein n=1 Tax=Ramazzottius varieornatus TaxID=947166 RepID=A0A1D1VMB7_RAMVA|nr:hypothetical protein RvY_10960-2 [Ramazzottius varieornatus]
MEQTGKSTSRSRFNLFNWDWDTGGKTSRSKSKSRDDRTVRSPSREPSKPSQPHQQELPPYRQGTLSSRPEDHTDQRLPPHRSAPVPPPRSISKTSGQKLISSRGGKSVVPEPSMYNVRQHQHDLENRRVINDAHTNERSNLYARHLKEEPLVAQKIAVVRKAELEPTRKKSGVDWEAPKKIIAVNENQDPPMRKYNQQSTVSGPSQKPSMHSLNTVQLSSESPGESPLMQNRARKSRNGEEERLEEVVWRKEAIGSQIKREAQRARTVGRRAGAETASLVNSHTDLRSVAKAGLPGVNQHNESRMARQEKPGGNQGAPRDRGTYRPEINLDDRRLFPSRDSANFTFESAVLALIRLRRLQARLIRSRDRFVKELELFRGWNDERYLHVLDQIAKSNNQMDELEPLIASLEAFIREQQTPSLISEHDVIRYPVSNNGGFETINGNGFYKSNDLGYPAARQYLPYPQPSQDEHSEDEYMRDLRDILRHSEETYPVEPLPQEPKWKGREPERTTRKSSQNLSKSLGRSGMKLQSFDNYEEQDLGELQKVRGNARENQPAPDSIAFELNSLKEKVRLLQVEKEQLEREQQRENQRHRDVPDSDQDTVRERNERERRSYERTGQQPTAAAVTSRTSATNGQPARSSPSDQFGNGATYHGDGTARREEVDHGSVGSGSDEVSVDDPSYQYADFV